jgi:hypothetical protein
LLVRWLARSFATHSEPEQTSNAQPEFFGF